VCIFIGAQAMVDTDKTGGRNPLVDAALAIDALGGRTAEELELDAIRGERVADRVEDDPRFAPQPADPEHGAEASNADGSFERLMQLMGGGSRPPMPDINSRVNGDGG